MPRNCCAQGLVTEVKKITGGVGRGGGRKERGVVDVERTVVSTWRGVGDLGRKKKGDVMGMGYITEGGAPEGKAGGIHIEVVQGGILG